MDVVVKHRGGFRFTARDKDGNIKWVSEFPNGVTTAGLNHLLNVEFHGTTQVTTWYIGLIDNASFSALDATDTMASHGGWIENANYDEATRVAWVEGAASGGVMTNPSPSVFTISATVTILGAFLTSVSTKSDNTGTLFATGLALSPQALVDNDTLEVTYTATLVGVS